MRQFAPLPLCLFITACVPDFTQPASLVTGERILAVRGAPAEARPGATVTWDTLVVTPNGTVAMPMIDWTLCLAPKPLDEDNIVANACLGNDPNAVQSIGTGSTAQAALPLSACALFGPDPPPQMPGQPPLRPRDPDVTGGYYQPIRLNVSGGVGFGLERITCNLAAAGADVAVHYAREYMPNNNPHLIPPTASVAGQPLDLSTAATVSAGSVVHFSAGWTADSPESFPVYDIVSQELVTRREALRIAWFASGGSFDHEVTGRDEQDMALTVDNDWTAPQAAALVHVWLVLRDSRGGVDFATASVDLMVTP
jgi:hypothetical protein